MSKVLLPYKASSGTIYILNSTAPLCRVKDANFHTWEWTPQGADLQYGFKLDRFDRDAAMYTATLYFGGPLAERKARIEALHKEWETDIREMTPGRITWGTYYIDCYIIKSNTYPAKDGWHTADDITIYAPRPFWRSDTKYTIKTMMPGYGYPINTGLLWPSHCAITMHGPCVRPVVSITGEDGNTTDYGIRITMGSTETVTIDTEARTIIKDNGSQKVDVSYLCMDPETVFTMLPPGRIVVNRSSGEETTRFTIDLTIHVERSEPRRL